MSQNFTRGVRHQSGSVLLHRRWAPQAVLLAFGGGAVDTARGHLCRTPSCFPQGGVPYRCSAIHTAFAAPAVGTRRHILSPGKTRGFARGEAFWLGMENEAGGESFTRPAAAGDTGDDASTTAVAVAATATAAASATAATADASKDEPTGESEGGDTFPAVSLDPDAVQKFAEIKVRWGGKDSPEKATVLIRGLKSAAYHKDAAFPTMVLLREAGAAATIVGGGRIKHSTSKRTIFVYGYSMQFGQANLTRVADLCREAYPGYEVTWSEGGY